MKPPQFRDPDEADRADWASDTLAHDLEALRKATARDLPHIDETVQAARKRALRVSQEGWLMNLVQSLKFRPWLATAVGAAVVAAVLLAVPISYTRTTGYEARLALAGPLPQGTDLARIADEFGKALDAEDVSIHAGMGGSSLVAHLPVRARSTVQGITEAFARELNERGLEAEARVQPVTERVTGNVYAAAANQIVAIQVNSEGKTDAEIADEIRAQLEEAGFSGAFVDVETGDGKVKIEMQMTRDSGDPLGPIQVNIDGKEPPTASCEGECARVLDLRLTCKGGTPEEVEQEIRAQLEAMGIEDADIVVHQDENGMWVEVKSLGCCPDGSMEDIIELRLGDGECCPDVNAAPKSGQKSESWSDLKKEYR